MKIPESVWAGLRTHCLTMAEQHVEACGVLAGPAADEGQVTELYLMVNVAEQPRVRFEFDREAQVTLWNLLEDLGKRPRVVYHAHLNAGPELSPTDRQYALDPTLRYLVYAVPSGHAAMWRVTSGVVEPVGFSITPNRFHNRA